MSLPPGFRFMPTDEVLIKDYLLKKHAGTLPPIDWVKECDLYGELEPWEIWEKFGGNRLTSIEDDLFFFATVKKKNSSYSSRRVGTSGGTWHRENKDKIVEVKAPVEVVEKKFSYRRIKEKKNSYPWMMIEYSVKDSPMSDLVVCRLRLKRSQGKRKAIDYENCEGLLDQNKRSKVDVEVPVTYSYSNGVDADPLMVGGDMVKSVSISNGVDANQMEEGIVHCYEDLGAVNESDWDKPSLLFDVDEILNVLNDPKSDEALNGEGEMVRADCVEEPLSNSNGVDADPHTVGGDVVKSASISKEVDVNQIEEGAVSCYEGLGAVNESDCDVDDILNVLNAPKSDEVLNSKMVVEAAQIDKPLDCTSNVDQWFDYENLLRYSQAQEDEGADIWTCDLWTCF